VKSAFFSLLKNCCFDYVENTNIKSKGFREKANFEVIPFVALSRPFGTQVPSGSAEIFLL
jgi:hypothetical protein